MFFSLINVRSGNINFDKESLRGFGEASDNWSSASASCNVGNDRIYSYSIGMNPSTIYPSNAVQRWYGYPVRCLVY